MLDIRREARPLKRRPRELHERARAMTLACEPANRPPSTAKHRRTRSRGVLEALHGMERCPVPPFLYRTRGARGTEVPGSRALSDARWKLREEKQAQSPPGACICAGTRPHSVSSERAREHRVSSIVGLSTKSPHDFKRRAVSGQERRCMRYGQHGERSRSVEASPSTSSHPDSYSLLARSLGRTGLGLIIRPHTIATCLPAIRLYH